MKIRITIGVLVLMALMSFTNPLRKENIHVSAQVEDPSLKLPEGQDLTLFGLVGLARGQTARLTVVNLRRAPKLELTPEQVVTQIPCRVRLRFVDQRGNTIARSVESIIPENGAFLDLPFSTAVPNGFEEKRIEVRAIVRQLSRAEDERHRCATIATLEIFDNESGHTAVIYPELPQ